jgi:hypothetical protein
MEGVFILRAMTIGYHITGGGGILGYQTTGLDEEL